VVPLLTIGLAVLGLIVTTSVVWLAQRWQEEARQQELEARRQRIEEIERQIAEEDLDALKKRQACREDEACRRELVRAGRQVDALQQEQEACRQDEACQQELVRRQREQLSQTWDPPSSLEPTPSPGSRMEQWDTKFLKFIGGAVVTLPVLLCALYVIIAPSYRDADKKWAYGAVGTLLGFWLGTT
jgi:hypothetical protein